ncbi:MAG: hypothetical protein K9K63_03400 [Desulfotignum sp.]|nr:hypothetical protein [Desulfotignum sp.]MCF8087545.1 hypothetical protein [Desulfotignum sp.]MCF8136334.1 hypothetical protein [Desulfotignum sp.]
MTAAWTRIQDLKDRLEKKWRKGVFLAQRVTPEEFMPLRIPLKHPTARELTHDFAAARDWVAHWVSHETSPGRPGFDIEWHAFTHRSLGKNRIPRAVIFSTLADVVSFLGKTRQAERFHTLFHTITDRFPQLAGLLRDHPLTVLQHDKVWEELLAIMDFMTCHPLPGIYIRQLEIPGVDTKFIETHKAWLVKLLTCVLPETVVDDAVKGPAAFENRFGFLSRPARVRFRCLDPDLFIMGLSDLEIPAHDFARLPVQPDTLFIVENDITALSFPPFPNAQVIFGRGYSLSVLCQARWMADKPLWYWGDLDTHGFAMIHMIRHYFPQTRSFLMDEATLLSHKPLWGTEPSPVSRDLPLLTPDEARVYDALRNHTHTPNLRLEQERISFTLVRRVVEDIRMI